MSSEHDRAILNCIFNPLLPVGESIYDEELPDTFKDVEEEDEDTEATRAAKSLEIEGIRAAESGNLEEAITLFTRAIAAAPLRPSGYNNRAQAHRIMGDTQRATSDLDRALELGGGRGRTACQALCQRGTLHRGEGRDDLAREDFKAAAELGSKFARAQLVEMNPYAAMCNQMLYEVMGKLK